MSVLLEFSIFPTDRGASVSAEVSQVIAMIRDTGASYQLTPMGTVVETERVGDALALVERAARLLDEAGCERIYSSLKLDIRRGPMGRLQGKLASVREKVGEVNTGGGA